MYNMEMITWITVELPATILIVAAISHSFLHTPGVVEGGGAGVVVVVVVTRLVVGSVLNSVIGLVAVAFLCASSNFSIEKGVVEGDGQPVNSVDALKEEAWFKS